MARKKEVAVQHGNYTEELPDYLKDKQDSTRGQEGVGIDDLTIPRLGLVQDLSPQRKKSKPEYIEGAEEGMLFNSVTHELYGASVQFVPVFFRKEWCIWKTQDSGGGFHGSFETEALAISEFNDKGYDDDYEIVDMAQHFGIILHDDKKPEEIVISMSKSKMKVNRQFNTLVKMAGGDRFSRAYTIGSVEDTNSADQDFYNLSVAPLGFVTEEVFNMAEVMYNNVSDGTKDVERKADA